MKQHACRLLVGLMLMSISMPVVAQGLFYKATHPDMIGGHFVVTHQDGIAPTTSGGPGLELFAKYRLSPKLFLSAGTGVYTITDETLSMNTFRTTLLPAFEVRIGGELTPNTGFSPFLYGGLQAFGSRTNVLNLTTTDMVFDGSALAGAGIRISVSDRLSFQLSGDYRYIFTSSANPKPKLWVAKAGISYEMQPSMPRGGDDMEYPLGDGEIVLDDLFKTEGGDGASTEEDALALLFAGEDDSGTEGSLFGAEESGSDVSMGSDNNSNPTYGSSEVADLLSQLDNLRGEIDQKGRLINNLQSQVQDNEKTIAELSGRLAGGAGRSFGISSPDEFKGKYEEGLQKFYAKQYRAAIEHFNRLMQSNPDHRLASNCQYWIGESYNALGDYRPAVTAFNSVLQYNSSYKFDDALIMSGLCHLKLGDRMMARENFQQLVSRFPDSEYAPKAMRYLGRL